jgi:hypothetical protein
MARNIDVLAKKLGASVVGPVPDYSAGAFGMAVLANTSRRRLAGRPATRATGGHTPKEK